MYVCTVYYAMLGYTILYCTVLEYAHLLLLSCHRLWYNMIYRAEQDGLEPDLKCYNRAIKALNVYI